MSATAATDAALGELHGFCGEMVMPGAPSYDPTAGSGTAPSIGSPR
jgi:hypothetical protein